jgi:hypothetical protein
MLDLFSKMKFRSSVSKVKFSFYSLIEDIRVNLLKTHVPIKEKEILFKIFSKIQNSSKFFQILEDLLSTGDLQNRSIILDILSHLGQNSFYLDLVQNKLESPKTLIQKNNITQSLAYLNYSNESYIHVNRKFISKYQKIKNPLF